MSGAARIARSSRQRCVDRLVFREQSLKAVLMKMRLLAGITLVASAAATALCAETPAPQKTIGINPGYRNLSAKPGDDFEEYANGGLRKTSENPADPSRTAAGAEAVLLAQERTAGL